ncbi:MAG: MFS transporter [Salinicola sp.]|uniref:LysE family translocator n=1 Tax=uncultured Salinicola sp. TaxID=1193542 RepID=UPI000C8E492D|nr:LysE family transporter [uncultured Salinicola sp.]MAM59266.1 MFS transporter [Salinicola sp.]|tara:strand:- start:1320 stop:1952 length:633 start_codon:yes stop_codon:yes gene_type:complete
MEILHGLIVITFVHLLAAASPGPDFVLVTQQTLNHGKRIGLLCSLGIALGLSIHIVYSAFGLAAVIANSAEALWAIKLLGGAYLLYLGIKGLRSRPASLEPGTDNAETLPPRSALRTVGTGFLCNALNPKAPIYFVSLFTIVLSPDMPLYQIAIYGAWIMLIQLGWFSAVALLLSTPPIHRAFKRFSHWIDRVLGLAMVALGIKVLTTRV